MWRSLALVLCCAALATGCNRTSPEELMKQAEEARAMQNFPLAIELYTRVIAEHPKSLQAETAAFLIGTTYNNDLRDYEKAIPAYRDFLSRYPQGAQAPMALFMIAYLFHNELRNLDSAGAAYREFLAAYPEHEMTPSAKFELENLGKSPEELIPNEVAVQTPSAKTPAQKK